MTDLPIVPLTDEELDALDRSRRRRRSVLAAVAGVGALAAVLVGSRFVSLGWGGEADPLADVTRFSRSEPAQIRGDVVAARLAEIRGADWGLSVYGADPDAVGSLDEGRGRVAPQARVPSSADARTRVMVSNLENPEGTARDGQLAERAGRARRRAARTAAAHEPGR